MFYPSLIRLSQIPSDPSAQVEEYRPQTGEVPPITTTLTKPSETELEEEEEELQSQQQEPQEEENVSYSRSILVSPSTSAATTTISANTASSTQEESLLVTTDPDQEARSRAAICIQAHYRGHLARKNCRLKVTIKKETTEYEDTEQEKEPSSKTSGEIVETTSRPESQNSKDEELKLDEEPAEPVAQVNSESEQEDQDVASESGQSDHESAIAASDSVGHGTDTNEPSGSVKSSVEKQEESVPLAVESGEYTNPQTSSRDLETTTSSQETHPLPGSADVTEEEVGG